MQFNEKTIKVCSFFGHRDTVITKSVSIGDVIITDVCGLGVDIVATANIQCIDKCDS